MTLTDIFAAPLSKFERLVKPEEFSLKRKSVQNEQKSDNSERSRKNRKGNDLSRPGEGDGYPRKKSGKRSEVNCYGLTCLNVNVLIFRNI